MGSDRYRTERVYFGRSAQPTRGPLAGGINLDDDSFPGGEMHIPTSHSTELPGVRTVTVGSVYDTKPVPAIISRREAPAPGRPQRRDPPAPPRALRVPT